MAELADVLLMAGSIVNLAILIGLGGYIVLAILEAVK